MPYKLFNRVGSGGFVVEAALTLAEQPFELVLIESVTRTPMPQWFREVNPWLQVPVLITPDGDTVTESAAILIHLCARHPDKALAPPAGSREYGQFLRWMFFMSSNLYESVLRVTYPERFTTDASITESVAEAARIRMGQALTLMEEQLSPNPFLFGNLGVADLYLAMMYAWSEGELTCPRIEALTHAVASHPLVEPSWKQNFDHTVKKKFGDDWVGK